MKAFCETWFCCSDVSEIYIDTANNEEDDQVSIHSVEDHVSFTTGSITLLIQSVVAGIAIVVGFMNISVRKGLDRLRFVYKNCNFLASMGSKIKPITYTCQAQPRL